MHPVLQYMTICFAVLFTVKMIWLGYMVLKGTADGSDDSGRYSGWG